METSYERLCCGKIFELQSKASKTFSKLKFFLKEMPFADTTGCPSNFLKKGSNAIDIPWPPQTVPCDCLSFNGKTFSSIQSSSRNEFASR